MSYKEIFDKMRAMLVYAFDDVTVFDMRRQNQIELIIWKSLMWMKPQIISAMR